MENGMVHKARIVKSVSKGGTESCIVKSPKQDGNVKNRRQKPIVEDFYCMK